MNIVFATTNERKLEDLKKVIEIYKYENIQVFSLKDIGWDCGEILETGTTLEQNSLIKAQKVYDFCMSHQLDYIIIADDAGLFVDALNGEPGIYTGRYADKEIKDNPNLPKYEAVNKLLRNMAGFQNRNATYKSVITLMNQDGSYIQDGAETKGYIAKKIIGELKKPYFYSVFIVKDLNKVFSNLTNAELLNTYRYEGLHKILNRVKNK